MPLILIISIVVSVAVALVSLSWFFRDGEESTRSFQESYDRSFNPFSFTPWWATKFGLWMGLAAGAGIVCCTALSHMWNWIASRF
jgi:hypothetical protein